MPIEILGPKSSDDGSGNGPLDLERLAEIGKLCLLEHDLSERDQAVTRAIVSDFLASAKLHDESEEDEGWPDEETDF